MQRTPQTFEAHDPVVDSSTTNREPQIPSPGRRKFLGRMGMAATAASILGKVPAFAEAGRSDGSLKGAAAPNTSGNIRVLNALNLRINKATHDSLAAVPPHTTNGDEQRYTDKSGSYSKPLLQDDICLVNQAAWNSFKKAFNSGKQSDWEAVILGGTGTLNGPQGSYAYDLEALDSVQFGNAPGIGDPTGPVLVPPFDALTSNAYGTQLIEMYWASMLRDVAFTDFDTNTTAQAASAEISAQPNYRGPRDSAGKVTTNLLFRGTFQGETLGPWMSQFAITPTAFGQQAIPMQFSTHVAGVDYMTDPTTFLQAQNGQDTGLRVQLDPTPRYLHNFRGLASLTHVDGLYQEFLNALLTMYTFGVPPNPGSPYVGSKTQNGFSTWGGPDQQQTVAEVAARALNKVWYQKWLVHLTHRPEWGGGLVHQKLTGNPRQAVRPSNVLNSQAVADTFSKYGTYFLPQAFPEGSPNHPSYPTGHGTAAPCITVLKFFFDGSYVIPNPMVPSNDGLSLLPYTGSDAGQLTVNGELNKLARNVSFGHGVGAGIHWRTDTDSSMLLGEAIAISFLQDRAQTYNEHFSITITKLDGNAVTISN